MASWTTIGVQLPQTVLDASSILDSLVGALLQLFELAQTVLDVVRAFLISLLDPIQALIAALIEQIEALLADLRQLGVYLTGDFASQWPFNDLLGGYAAYERRMIARLTDRSDPSRPDFSPKTTVLGVFFYTSFTSEELFKALNFLDSMRRFFGVPTTEPNLPQPVGLKVAYGVSSTGVGAFGLAQDVLDTGAEPSVAVLQWTLPSPNPPVAWPLPAPKGFLVEISPYENGLQLAYSTPAPQAQDPSHIVQGLVTSPEGRPFRLYGGSLVTSSLSEGVTTIAGYASPTGPALTPELIAQVQKSFYVPVPAGFNVVSPGQPFTLVLRLADMPLTVDVVDNEAVIGSQATEVYARVSSVTGEGFSWRLTDTQVIAGAALQSVRLQGSEVAKGAPSAPLKITFPSAKVGAWLDLVTTALAVFALSRSDLPAQGVGASFQVDTAAEPTGLEALADIVAPLVKTPAGRDVVSWRSALLQRCRGAANALLQKGGPPPDYLLDFLVQQNSYLTSVTWEGLAGGLGEGLTILQSLAQTSDPGFGVAAHPLQVADLDSEFLACRIGPGGVDLARTPGFQVPDAYVSAIEPEGLYLRVGQGSADMSPVLYAQNPLRVQFCRNVLLSNPEVLTQAAAVLNFAVAPLSGSRGGAWLEYRLFPQGLVPVDAALNEIQGFLNVVQTGTTGIVDSVTAYIDFLQARILELEALLQRIQGMIDLLQVVQIPEASGLIVTGEGTAGILSEFVTAENKPSDSGTVLTRITPEGRALVGGTYGVGAAIVTGGLPTALVTLFGSLFVTSD